jgi:hypothetical protein
LRGARACHLTKNRPSAPIIPTKIAEALRKLADTTSAGVKPNTAATRTTHRLGPRSKVPQTNGRACQGSWVLSRMIAPFYSSETVTFRLVVLSHHRAQHSRRAILEGPVSGAMWSIRPTPIPRSARERLERPRNRFTIAGPRRTDAPARHPSCERLAGRRRRAGGSASPLRAAVSSRPFHLNRIVPSGAPEARCLQAYFVTSAANPVPCFLPVVRPDRPIKVVQGPWRGIRFTGYPGGLSSFSVRACGAAFFMRL